MIARLIDVGEGVDEISTLESMSILGLLQFTSNPHLRDIKNLSRHRLYLINNNVNRSNLIRARIRSLASI